MGMRIPSVRDAVQPSDGSDGETLPPPLSFRLLRTHFPYSLYIEQLPKALRGPSTPLAEPLPPYPWTKGVDLREGGGGGGVDLREDGGSTFAEIGGRRPRTRGGALRGDRSSLSETRSPTRPDVGYRQEKERRLDRFDANQRRRQAKSQVGRPSWRPRRHTPELEPFGTRTSYAKLKSQKSARLVRRFTPPSRSLLPP